MKLLEAPEAKLQPNVGETILFCEHYFLRGQTVSAFYYDPPLTASAGRETDKVRFLFVCQRCLDRNHEDPLKAATARGTWGHDETPIRQTGEFSTARGLIEDFDAAHARVTAALEKPEAHVFYAQSRYCSEGLRRRRAGR